MQGRTPNKKEKQWMDSISNFGCIVCKLFYQCDSPAEIHHIDGKTKPEAHLKTLPLCYKHHREGVNNELYVSRHPFKKEFENRYGNQYHLLERLKELVEND
jgi:rubredoxin